MQNLSYTLLTSSWELLHFVFMKQSVDLPLSSVSVWFGDSSSASMQDKPWGAPWLVPGNVIENAVVSLGASPVNPPSLALFFRRFTHRCRYFQLQSPCTSVQSMLFLHLLRHIIKLIDTDLLQNCCSPGISGGPLLISVIKTLYLPSFLFLVHGANNVLIW